MQETVKERLIRYLKCKKIGQNKFENLAGISNGYISNLKSTPGAAHLTKIFSVSPDLNEKWLLTGEGSMLKSDVHQVTEGDGKPYTVNSHNIKYVENEGRLSMIVPVVPYNAYGSLVSETPDLPLDRDSWEEETFDVDKVYHGNYLAFQVDNDSMDDGSRDSFQRGDIVLVRELEKEDWLPHIRFEQWPFWVICWGNCIRIKQITKQDGDIITLHSLNPSPEFTDFTLRLSEISRLFNVVQVKPKPRTFKF